MFYDVVGWAGMILVLAAYVLLSTNKIKNGYLYQWLNFFAALLMAIGLFPKNAWFSFSLQVVWGIVALIAIVKLSQKKPTKKKNKK
jgi:hypothetical protein